MPSFKSQSSGVLGTALHFAKKLAQTGVDALGQMSPAVTQLDQAPEQQQVLEGQAAKAYSFEKRHYEHPQLMMREHLPRVSSQLLGRHYTALSRVGHMISPELNQKVADYLFDYLNQWVSEQTSVHAVLGAVGAADLAELQKDSARSGRISQALCNQNKIIASLIGGFTGMTGVVGAAIDVPTSLMLALKSIYQTGRAYGFEINAEDHAVIEYIFKHIDLGSVAEKQAVLAALRGLHQLLNSHDVQQLQQLLGSSNDIAPLKKWLNHNSLPTWAKTNVLAEWKGLVYLAKLTPLFGMGVSVLYSCHLVEDATFKAEHVFAGARQYLLAHPEQELDPLAAYLLQQQEIAVDHVVVESNLESPVDVEVHALTPVDVQSAVTGSSTSIDRSELTQAATVLVEKQSKSTQSEPIETVASQATTTATSPTTAAETESVRNTTKAEQSVAATTDTLSQSTSQSGSKSTSKRTTTTRKRAAKKPVTPQKN